MEEIEFQCFLTKLKTSFVTKLNKQQDLSLNNFLFKNGFEQFQI